MWLQAEATMTKSLSIRNFFQCFNAPSEPSTSHSPASAQQDSQEASTSSPTPRRDNPSPALQSTLQESALLTLPGELQMNIIRYLDRDSLPNLRSTCTALKQAVSKAVTHVKVENREDLREAIEAYKEEGITALTVTDTNLNDDDLLLLKNLPELKELNLAWCWLLTDRGLVHLKSLTKLQKLNLTGCYQLTDNVLFYLKSHTELQELNLTVCQQLTDASLIYLKSHTELQRLNLAGCQLITDAGLACLKFLIKLEQLNLTGCLRLTDAGMDSLRNQLTNCVVTTSGAASS